MSIHNVIFFVLPEPNPQELSFFPGQLISRLLETEIDKFSSEYSKAWQTTKKESFFYFLKTCFEIETLPKKTRAKLFLKCLNSILYV